MYRLAHVIGVSWKEFKKLTLQEIRNLSIVTGELRVSDKIDRLDVLMAYHHTTHSEKPGEQRAEYEKRFRSPVSLEPELTKEEFEDYAIEHNKRMMEELNNVLR
ncbi:MAG: hypothetical protein ROO71_09025 [Balneola sp.]